jgi:ribonuclease BN (tRNA processing enzyme)
MRIADGDRALVFTGDASLTSDLVEHARGADLLLSEATYAVRTGPPDGVHMTAAEAAFMAGEAAVGRLVLTHLAAEDREASLQAARATFPATDLALPGATFEV